MIDEKPQEFIERMNRKKPESTEITWRGMLVEVRGHFKKARPAPKCSNPDSPSFSDDGEKAEADLTEAFFIRQTSNYTDRIVFSEEMLAELQDETGLTKLLGLEG